ncbi:MAG: hypothetical protein ACLP9L_30890 [Thermoguttaceae bacterium]
MKLRMIAAMAIALASLLRPGAAAADKVVLEPAEMCSNLFADSDTQLLYRLQSTVPLKGRIRWSLSVHQRTIAHGAAGVNAEAGKTIDFAFPLKTPHVKEGVVLQTQCSVAEYADGEQRQEPLAIHDKTLWIFPRDPFVDRHEWLKSLKITLYDPEGKTADRLEKAAIPFTLSRNIDALDGVEQGVLVIGEATAWRDHRSLGEVMVKAAARGMAVLCLAPGEGSIELPGAEGADMPRPSSLALRREDFVTEVDTRLDAVWPAGRTNSDQNPARQNDNAAPGTGSAKDPQPLASMLAIRSDRQRVIVEAAQDRGGWAWLDVRFSHPNGRLLVCGMPIVRQWDSHPAPRYLLLGLLERLAAK